MALLAEAYICKLHTTYKWVYVTVNCLDSLLLLVINRAKNFAQNENLQPLQVKEDEFGSSILVFHLHWLLSVFA